MVHFSVVIPVYNKKPHIKRCVKSALNQNYNDFEIIIVDDLSSDGSFEELQKFSNPKVRIYRRNNPGPGGYAARNLGIEKAKHDWIAFLDADDEWRPNHLKSMAHAINVFPEGDIFGAGYNIFNGVRSKTQPYYNENKNKKIHKVSFPEFIRIYLNGMRFSHTSVTVVKKRALENMGGFPSGRTDKGGDLYTWIKVFSNGYGVWSPHIGANVYHDAVNKVTHSSYFNINFLKSIPSELGVSKSNEVLLKKYINSLILKDYIRCIINLNKKEFLLLNNVFFIDIRKTIFYLLLDLTPSFLLKGMLDLRRRAKK